MLMDWLEVAQGDDDGAGGRRRQAVSGHVSGAKLTGRHFVDHKFQLHLSNQGKLDGCDPAPDRRGQP